MGNAHVHRDHYTADDISANFKLTQATLKLSFFQYHQPCFTLAVPTSRCAAGAA